jgi:cell division protein FtsB
MARRRVSFFGDVLKLLPVLADPTAYLGSRSVTSLSQEALNRKRANDREAQRAIRARTKEHIEKLEQEVKELKDKHYGADLVRSLSHENQQLREQIAALRAIATNQSYARTRKFTRYHLRQ